MFNAAPATTSSGACKDAASSLPPPLTPSCPLSDYLAANSVSDVLALLQQDAVADSPDARLQVFSKIAGHLSAGHSAGHSGDFNSSRATSFDSAPHTASVESGPSPETRSQWAWADVLMRGVVDPWSRIRAVCLSPMADLLLAEVREEAIKAVAAPQNATSRPARATPAGGRRHSAGKVETAKKAPGVTKARRHSAMPSGQEESVAAAPLLVRRTSVSARLDFVWRHWEKATRWYEHDGIVRLLAKVYGRSRTVAGAALRADELGIRTLLFKVLFPAFRDPQLPVRESAAALLGVLVDRDRPAPLSPAILSFIVDHVSSTLARVPMPSRTNTSLSTAEQENTRVLEGNLLALVVLVDMNVVQIAESSVMPLLLRLASYPASSVRQYIAQILRPPSWTVFVYLMQRLCEHDGQQPRSANDKDESASELSWQRQETVMMALQQHFLSFTTIRATTHDMFRASEHAEEVLVPLRRTTALSVVFGAMQSSRFEVARMGTQLFPLLLQCCVRFLAPADLPCIFDACCGAAGCIRAELDALHAAGDAAALSRAQTTVATIVLPALWFYVVVRRIQAEVTGSAAASPTSGAPSVSRAEVEAMVRPYATLACITGASRARAVPDAAGAGVCDGGTSASALSPCVASTCALLVLTAYFAQVMDAAEWHRCVDAVLQPSWWVDLLSSPVRREQVRFGPDFVRAVHHCGTPEQARRVIELIPTLTAALPSAQTHQQCLLIAMIRVAVTGRTALATPQEERAMAYVYHDVYTAPALTEGGEAAPLGHTWLKLFVPTSEGIPTAIFWGPPEPLASGGGDQSPAIGRDSAAFCALDTVCFRDLFRSTKTEPSVWREIRLLMMSLSRLSLLAGSPAADQVDWYALSMESVFGRLDNVCPRWRETAAAAAGDDGAAAAEAGGEEEGEGDVTWDDWDDDEDDADGCAQGIYEAEAIKTAVAMVTTLREWAGADERFRAELTALGVK